MNLLRTRTPRASQHEIGWKAPRRFALLPVAGEFFLLTFPFYRTALSETDRLFDARGKIGVTLAAAGYPDLLRPLAGPLACTRRAVLRVEFERCVLECVDSRRNIDRLLPAESTDAIISNAVAILFPFQSIKSSTPSDSALAKSHIITSAESALPKSKDFKSTDINTCKKTWGGGIVRTTSTTINGHWPEPEPQLERRNIEI
jgi:hypothetical protein